MKIKENCKRINEIKRIKEKEQEEMESVFASNKWMKELDETAEKLREMLVEDLSKPCNRNLTLWIGGKRGVEVNIDLLRKAGLGSQ